MKFTVYSLQFTETYQVSGVRQITNDIICQMLPAKLMKNATCYLKNEPEVA